MEAEAKGSKPASRLHCMFCNAYDNSLYTQLMKMALIQVYNSLDGNLIEKPFKVLLENAGSAVKQRYDYYKKQIAKGIPIAIEYDIISTEARRPQNDLIIWAKKLQAEIESENPVEINN